MGKTCTGVLILDHDPITRDYAARIVENDGYLATEVRHAGEAFAALETNKNLKAIVASNQWRNGIDCIALAGTIRSYWPAIAVVLVSEHVFPSDTDLPSETLALLKPFTREQLLAALRAATAPLGRQDNRSRVSSGLVAVPARRPYEHRQPAGDKLRLQRAARY